ncbi:agmatinase, partial [Vibrio parahaemolyticus V-223/04]
HQFVVA